MQRVDISEVIELSEDLNTAATDLQTNLNRVANNIDEFTAMSSFSGKTAEEAKSYFIEFHQTLIKSFEILFMELEEQLKKHVRTFKYSVDKSESAMIDMNYLMETEESVIKVYDNLNLEQEAITETILSVSDISGAVRPSTWYVERDQTSVMKVITDLESDFESYTSSSRPEFTQIQKMLHHMEIAIKNAGAVSGSARFTNFAGNSKSAGLPVLKEYNDERYNEIMDKAKDAKEAALKGVKYSASKDVIDMAYKELADGEIDEETFYAILSSVKKADGIKNKNQLMDMDHKVFIEYLEERKMLEDYIASNRSFAEYVKNNLPKIGYDLTHGALAIFAERLGLTMTDVAKYLGSQPVPVTKASEDLLDKAGQILKYGKVVGRFFTVAGFAYGMYDDGANKGKTIGEALAHNLASLGTGSAVVIIGGLVVSSPISWGAALVAGAGVGATVAFEYMYHNNIFKLQDKVDWVGQKVDWVGEQLDNGFKTINRWTNDAADAVGEAITGAFDWINPFS